MLMLIHSRQFSFVNFSFHFHFFFRVLSRVHNVQINCYDKNGSTVHASVYLFSRLFPQVGLLPGNSRSSIVQENDLRVRSNTCTQPSTVASTGRSDPVQSAPTTLVTLCGLFNELSSSAYFIIFKTLQNNQDNPKLQ